MGVCCQVNVQKITKSHFKPGVGRWISRRNEEEEFLNFSTKVNVDWTVKPQILKRSKGFKKKAGEEIYINIKIFPQKKIRIGIIKGGKVKKYYELLQGWKTKYHKRHRYI